MAKILVADDNSNIQKMVGLALKDQGIDVVAVGNGEAAVRKISDVRPDLVLADVFMPVRNGYEVCNYVKTDSALSHIPVILLVGAFDPLDEQEAQRVGADGVLKKPFVPPDPLISMVKSALSRAGVVLGAHESAPPPPPPPPPAATPHVKPEAPPLPRVAPPPPPPAPEPEIDLGVPALASRPAPVNIDKNDQPLAFGSLLDSPAEEETVFTTPSGAGVAPDRDWGQHAAQEEEEVEEETSKTGSWRLSSMDEIPNEAPAGQTDWREAAFAGIGTDKSYKEWAPSAEKNSLSITEEEAAELAQKHEPLGAPASSGDSEDWSKAISAVLAAETVAPQQHSAPDAATAPLPAPVIEQAPTTKIPEPVLSTPAPAAAAPAEPPAPEAAPALNSWMAGAVSPWEAELQRASELTSTWDSAQIMPGAIGETSATEAFLDSGLMATAHEHVVEAIEEVKAEEPLAAAPAADDSATVESFYSHGGHALEEEIAASSAPQEPVVHETAQGVPPAAVVASEPAPAPAADMDELVAKVLAKMNPEVLQAVTREILKPVVEALVKSELNKK